MTRLNELLSECGLNTSIIIDDAFDKKPQVNDLTSIDWDNFYDDLMSNEDDKNLIYSLYPAFDSNPPEDLKNSQYFIEVLWALRKSLSETSYKYLFSDYENKIDFELSKLSELVSNLTDFGLECKTCGRESSADLKTADILFVDLFLGPSQEDADINITIDKVKNIYEICDAKPPIVVLMSRSHRLTELRNKFRDEAGLLGSAYRVVHKSVLFDSAYLSKLLFRLAQNYKEISLFSSFILAWQNGLTNAQSNFLRILRRLDLPEFNQISSLLLKFEGQELGDYLLDLFDRVLMHEIENNFETISTAKNLNTMDTTKCNAPHLEGTSDLQKLVYKMMFCHPKRLELTKNNGKLNYQFGDLLQWKNDSNNLPTNKVSLIVTPPCDLVRDQGSERNGADRILLLSGELIELKPEQWSYKDKPTSTPIIVFPDNRRYCIEWDLTSVIGLRFEELDALTNNDLCVTRIGRLRETFAIEIQHKLLSYIGRIGQPANPPATFPVNVNFYFSGTDGLAHVLQLNTQEKATCFAGRGKKTNPIHHLSLPENMCDSLEEAFLNLDNKLVSKRAKQAFNSLRADMKFFRNFELGNIKIPSGDKEYEDAPDGFDKNYLCVSKGGKISEGVKLDRKPVKSALLIDVCYID